MTTRLEMAAEKAMAVVANAVNFYLYAYAALIGLIVIGGAAWIACIAIKSRKSRTERRNHHG